MSLHTDIKEQLKEAMRAKDAVRLAVIRGLLTAFTNENVATKHKPDEELSDDMVLTVISREAKKRKDSIEQFTAAGRTELADAEKAELVILETYLPEQMGRDEILAAAQAKQAEMQVTDPAKKGILMGALMKDLKGRADGNVVKEVIDSLFA